MRLAHQLAEGKNIPHRFNTYFIEERKRNGTHLKTSKDFLATTLGLVNRILYNKTLQAIGLYRGTNEGSNGPKCGTFSAVGSSPNYSVPAWKLTISASMAVITSSTYHTVAGTI
jgi:hypothetical protein